MRLFLAMFTLALLVAAWSPTFPATAHDTGVAHCEISMQIADERLEAAVRVSARLPFGDLPCEDIPDARQLILKDLPALDLSGIQRFTSLVKITARGGSFLDLTPLARLPRLVELTLDDGQLSDITPLAALAPVQTLVLTNNQITDIAPLVGLLDLRFVDLRGNPIDCQAQAAHIDAIDAILRANTSGPFTDVPEVLADCR